MRGFFVFGPKEGSTRMKRSRVSEDVVVFFSGGLPRSEFPAARSVESPKDCGKGASLLKELLLELFVRLARTVQDCCVLRLVTNVSQQRVILYVRVAEKAALDAVPKHPEG